MKCLLSNSADQVIDMLAEQISNIILMGVLIRNDGLEVWIYIPS